MAIDTILYIDDSKVLQKKYSQVLQDAGYEVLIASDGQTGIATAESAHPSLIILDMLMPGLDGVEVLRRLKRTASTSNIPVLVLSGLFAEECRQANSGRGVRLLRKRKPNPGDPGKRCHKSACTAVGSTRTASKT